MGLTVTYELKCDICREVFSRDSFSVASYESVPKPFRSGMIGDLYACPTCVQKAIDLITEKKFQHNEVLGPKVLYVSDTIGDTSYLEWRAKRPLFI